PIRLSQAISVLERGTLAAERPLRRLVGSGRLNPLPHAGTISNFLLIVIIVTGVYLLFFYEFGFDASYDSVAGIEANVVQRFIRAAHRYASAALVLTTLVHGWRIFVAGRFDGGRRWRWLTGVLALVVVWLAGVTGYWMIWDVRAQALTEALVRSIEWIPLGADWVIDSLLGSDAGTGWPVLFLLWSAHLLLTAVIVWFLWRHLRKSHLRWLPPRHWMIIMGAVIALISLAIPVGMLDPADPTTLVGSVPLDPFYLFLVPPLLSTAPWLALAGLALAVTAGAVIPWLLRRGDPEPVVIDEERCTGCELCVIDCPYEALEMEGDLAVVDPERCVACGICIGSCSFGAMVLPGFEPVTTPDVEGRDVVIACQRHLRLADLPHTVTTVEVTCAGMVNPLTIGSLITQGASSVEVVGCPPADCAYGLGNEILAQRLAGERRPRLQRKWDDLASAEWVPPTELAAAVENPGAHRVADSDTVPQRPWRLAGTVALVAVSIGLVVLATNARFDQGRIDAEIVVLVEHVPGAQLVGQETATGTSGSPVDVVVTVDGEQTTSRASGGGDVGGGVVDVITVPVEAGIRAITVELREGGSLPTVVLADTIELVAGRRVIIEARDVPPPASAELGERLFSESALGRNVGCVICHSAERGDDGVGPSLHGVATRASSRVGELTAEQYLRESILEPDAYVVDGYPEGQMLGGYEETLSERDLDSLIAYLLTLEE
ncbi:MAG: 4Fe-4S binding protein, partial [Acidimicrobiia bacterium]|nr:4Fe-4S binding protein [Acidimicrobiia bacterium]